MHVLGSGGEAKFRLDPEIELAKNYRLSERELNRVRELIVEQEKEIRDAWNRHFGS